MGLRVFESGPGSPGRKRQVRASLGSGMVWIVMRTNVWLGF